MQVDHGQSENDDDFGHFWIMDQPGWVNRSPFDKGGEAVGLWNSLELLIMNDY